jgi:hypothetical protein
VDSNSILAAYHAHIPLTCPQWNGIVSVFSWDVKILQLFILVKMIASRTINDHSHMDRKTPIMSS